MNTRLGIVGCGAVIDYFYRKQLPKLAHVRVAGVSDRDGVRAGKAAAYFGCPACSFDELLARCDFLIIATPPQSHYSLAAAALEKKVGVLVEKPFVLTRAEAENLIDCSNQHRAPLYVSHFRRYFPSVKTAREVLQTGVLGEVRAIEMYEGGIFRWNTASGYVASDPHGGVLYDTGSHTVDVALYVSGLDRPGLACEVDSVQRDKEEPAHEIDAKFRLSTDNRTIQARLLLSRRNQLANRVRLHCENGWLECGLQPSSPVRMGGGQGDRACVIRPRDPTKSDGECFRRMCEAIFTGEAAATLSGRLFLNQMNILESIYCHGH
jgi:predicted dehydrogenase